MPLEKFNGADFDWVTEDREWSIIEYPVSGKDGYVFYSVSKEKGLMSESTISWREDVIIGREEALAKGQEAILGLA